MNLVNMIANVPWGRGIAGVIVVGTPFLELCDKLEITKPARVASLVRASFKIQVHESVLFLVLGYDYWFYPRDSKAFGLYEAFLLNQDGSTLKCFIPQLNIGQGTRREIMTLWFDPKVSLTSELVGDAVDEFKRGDEVENKINP